ncbi:LytTR family transcriptional regulator DNA-binding domain-containing protein [Sphingomonas sp. AR_OL41]|uniref:LytTR family transcriptional regulator DNA-binding domain-containing protein n=1 Tax=Sphingomonas sp. AR_OL41 TaxID=3042729 RepID=UPI00248010B5|nr:LytTR family transcriptional regulator DNA-binding domain-containing protein [Sphingomonas sp. AR_OL41]MDH7975512.1 LytTR family transcriptional regulator DNA-binding domain-containing protein [Sphingomonas sp. AR_OL41]
MPRSVTPALVPRNGAFAKHVRRFADRVRALPGFPTIEIVAAAAAVLLVVVGAFGTGALPLPTRLVFWAMLMGWSTAKWQAWFALTVRHPRGWTRAVLLGAVVLNLPLPLEIGMALRLVGVPAATRAAPHMWASALAITAVVFAMLYLARSRSRPVSTVFAASGIVPGGVLAKAGIVAPAALAAIRAEDHYCRLFLVDGRSRLIHHRFGDALREVAGFDGCQIHRGAWAANAAVVAAERDGRAWRLVLADGTRLAVSARFVSTLRARGWLNRAPAR